MLARETSGRYTQRFHELDIPMKTVLIHSLLALCLLSGCGQTGPLYLPDQAESPEAVSEQEPSGE